MRLRNPTDVGLVIRERRKALGLDQRELARRLGVSRQWVVAVERGKPGAGIGLVLRTLAILDLPLTVDLGQKAPPAPDPAGTQIDLDVIINRSRVRKR